MDYSIRIGGEAGQGLQVVGSMLARVLSRFGYHVFTNQDSMSRIRGGHNYYQLRFSEKPVGASTDRIDLLLALDANTIDIHRTSVREGGIILYDAADIGKEFSGPEFYNVPFAGIVEKMGVAPVMANSAAVGAVHGIISLGLEKFDVAIDEVLHKKGQGVIDTNRTVARAGYDYVRKEHGGRNLPGVTAPPGEKLLLINGNQAIGLGALMSGCKFYAAYPMTPSTSIMAYLSSKAKEYSLIVEQAEDEIAAINMALGASYGGVRAMTGTSGGGFALMNEGLSLAGMTETPVVVAEVQRPGPATGLPTRTEQGDLFFVLFSGHGEFPRVLFTPGTPEQAFFLTNKAFDLAEKYQIPVVVQSDQYLADTEWTYPGFDLERLHYEDYRLHPESGDAAPGYKRYAYTESGVSPLAVPGTSKHLVVVDSDEHDQEGHIIEDAETRRRMVDKRLLRKLPAISREIAPPALYGHREPAIVLVCYGSTWGVVREAVDRLSDAHEIAMLHFSEVSPFPATEKFDYLALLNNATLAVGVENNATGQFARLMRMETGFHLPVRINRYDGRPFTIDSLLGELDEHLRRL
jgi:2-oxoglutarate ferredoxin oxidoreductase subunit alpha